RCRGRGLGPPGGHRRSLGPGHRRRRGVQRGVARERDRRDAAGPAAPTLRKERHGVGGRLRDRLLGGFVGLGKSVTKEIVCVVGARPNFMKMAPILESLRPNPEIQPFLVHTGQHYDAEMSRVFFDELGLPEPDQNLEIGSGTHGRQTGQIMSAFDALLEGRSTSAVVVVGDVNSTMACGLVAVKRGIPLAHVEAGLRSWDRSMPEEINRLVTDAVSDLLFATSEDAVTNLAAEGIPASRVRLV